MNVPKGFKRLSPASPATALVGPFFYCGHGADRLIGLRVVEKHCNLQGAMHGGMLATMADVALGNVTHSSSETPMASVTVNLSLDFAGPAKVGDWLQAKVDIQKRGRRLVYANCYISANEQRIVRASAVLFVIN